MYAFGTFYDRIGEERIKVLIDDADVKALVAASKKGEDELNEAADDLLERYKGITKYVAITGLVGHITEHQKATGTFVADDEEWLIAYGKSEEAVKKAYYKVEEEYHGADDDDWEE